MMRKVIAVCGIKGNGKDTVADYIIKQYPNWEKDSFAGTLKDAVSAIFGWDRKMLAGETPEDRAKREEKDKYWSEKLGFDVTPRNILQIFGTECVRNHFHKNIWVDSLERKVKNSKNNIIITDCRFKNEIDMLRNIGATVIRVERPPLPNWFRKCEVIGQKYLNNECPLYIPIPELADVHQSEWDWIGYDNPDYIIQNDGTLEELYAKVDEVMKGINNE